MSTSYIYAIGSGDDVFKIGKSDDPKRRLCDIPMGHASALVLAYTAACPASLVNKVERFTHRILSGKNVRGEWFCADLDEIKEAITIALREIVGNVDSHIEDDVSNKAANVHLRIPSKIRRELVKAAEEGGRSVSGFIIDRLRKSLPSP